MPLELVTGPASSGKTTATVERAAARYAIDRFAPTLVLVPTSRHADQFRRRLVERAGVAFGLEVATLNGWARDTVVADGARVASRAVLAAFAAKAVDAAGEGTVAPRALNAPFGEALAELVAEGISPEAFRVAAEGGGRQLRALAAVYEALARRLATANLSHPAAVAGLAAHAVAAGRIAVPALVVVDGFDYLRDGEVALVGELARHAEVLVTLAPDANARASHACAQLRERVPAAAEVQVAGIAAAVERKAFSAPDREGELRAIARDIKERLTSDRSLRPSDFAIAFRQVTPLLPLAKQVFGEYNLPLDPAAGSALGALPFGTWVRRFLLLGVNGWRTRDLLAVLRSDYVARRRWEIDRGHVAAIAAFARRKRLWGEFEGLEAIAAGMTSDRESERDHDRELAAGMALRRVLDDLGPLLAGRRDTPGNFARTFDEALFGAAPMARSLPETRAQVEAFRDLLRARVEVDEATGAEETSLVEWVDGLLREMERPALVIREAGGVVLAPVHSLHGLRFRYVALAGLAEGEFPAPRRLPGVLEGEARRLLRAAGLRLPPSARATEDELFAAAATRADSTLSFSRPRLDAAGRRRAASAYFPTAGEAESEPLFVPAGRAASIQEAAVAAARAWPGEALRPTGFAAWETVRLAAAIESRRRSFLTSGEYEGRIEPALAAGIVRPETVWSASRLESYVTCGFQYFGAYGLGLDELERELVGADPVTFGTVIHEILESAIGPLIAAEEPLSRATLPAVLARIDSAGRARWEDAPRARGFGRSGLWRRRWDRVRDRLRRMLDDEVEANAGLGIERVLGTEYTLKTALPFDEPMAFTGKIDRVDIGGSTAVVVDYKSGRAIRKAEIDGASRLQLQLYAAAIMAQEPSIERVISRFAYLRPTSEGQRVGVDSGADSEAVDFALARVETVRERVRAGHFEVMVGPFLENASERECPKYCAFRNACRQTPLSRWKTWP